MKRFFQSIKWPLFTWRKRLVTARRIDALHRHFKIHRWAFAVLVVVLLAGMMMPNFLWETIPFEEGAAYEGPPVYSIEGFVYKDHLAVAEERRALRAQYPYFYFLDPQSEEKQLGRLENRLEQIGLIQPEGASEGDWERVLASSDLSLIKTIAVEHAKRLQGDGILETPPPEERRGAVGGLENPEILSSARTTSDLSSVLIEEQYRNRLRSFERRFVRGMVAGALGANLFPKDEVNSRIDRLVAEEVPPLTIDLNRAEPIIQSGEIVGSEKAEILRQFNVYLKGRSFLSGVGLISYVVVVIALLAIYLYRFEIEIFRNMRKLVLIGLLFFLLIAFSELTVNIMDGVSIALPVPWSAAPVTIRLTAEIIPLAAISMLVTILLDPRLAVIFTVVVVMTLSGIGGSLFRETDLMIYFLVSGIVGAYSMRRCRKRADIMRSGVYIGLTNIVVIVLMAILSKEDLAGLGNSLLSGLFSGMILTPMIVLGILPVLENLFRITTDFTLLELSDLNNPLMRRLLLTSPGTYQHSLTVGNLSESAAEAIGANSLLCRVGSYYHDLGKMVKSEYYTENNMSGQDLHAKLKPSLSASILKSHVKEGINIARENHLPQAIIDFIPQHHGTAVMKFFYHAALEQAEGAPVDKQEFQYPGPKPQTVETAIVMLADSVEAACHSLKSPTSSKIEKTVKAIINAKFSEGQLDECDLTLKDLNAIAEKFTYILSGLYHTRVEYPDQKKTEELEKKAVVPQNSSSSSGEAVSLNFSSDKNGSNNGNPD